MEEFIASQAMGRILDASIIVLITLGVIVVLSVPVSVYRTRRAKLLFLRHGVLREWTVVSVRRRWSGKENFFKKSEWCVYKLQLWSQEAGKIKIGYTHRRSNPPNIKEGDTVSARTAIRDPSVMYFPDFDVWQGFRWDKKFKKYFPPKMIGLH